ncbi:universal stress protein [Blastococcus brunescens]|uniref:universal stress protein n=1 Tax=Blastococcus brunescens TaxID=1564165 RepID=UPI003BEF3F1B
MDRRPARGPRGVCACRVATEADAVGLVERTLAPWRDEFPDVPVTAEVRCADAAAALVAASDGAALVVLGAPGARRLTRAAGSVGRRVLARVAGPVVIIGQENRGTVPDRRRVRNISSR